MDQDMARALVAAQRVREHVRAVIAELEASQPIMANRRAGELLKWAQKLAEMCLPLAEASIERQAREATRAEDGAAGR